MESVLKSICVFFRHFFFFFLMGAKGNCSATGPSGAGSSLISDI